MNLSNNSGLLISTVMLGVKEVVNKYGNPEMAPPEMNQELDDVYHEALKAIEAEKIKAFIKAFIEAGLDYVYGNNTHAFDYYVRKAADKARAAIGDKDD